jgi:hypothetical protein
MWGQPPPAVQRPSRIGPQAPDLALSSRLVILSEVFARDNKSELTGPSVSEIHCDHKMCYESQANMTVFKDGTFSVDANYVEYEVERWNTREIVAKNVRGMCRMLNVLKFDLVQKKVYSLSTLWEPTNDLPKLSRELCAVSGTNLELKDMTIWKK